MDTTEIRDLLDQTDPNAAPTLAHKALIEACLSLCDRVDELEAMVGNIPVPQHPAMPFREFIRLHAT